MAVIESPSRPSVFMQVDQTNAAGRMSVRPLEYVDQDGRVYGHFQHSFINSSQNVQLNPFPAGGTVASIRWPDPTSFMAVLILNAYYFPTVVFAAQQELGLDAVIVRQYTVLDSGIPDGGSTKARFNMSKTLTNNTILSAGTNNTSGITAGTRVSDTNPFVVGGGLANIVNSAAGTQYVNPANFFGFHWEANMARGEHPIVLGFNDGIVIRNTVAIPANSTVTFLMDLTWAEMSAF